LGEKVRCGTGPAPELTRDARAGGDPAGSCEVWRKRDAVEGDAREMSGTPDLRAREREKRRLPCALHNTGFSAAYFDPAMAR